MVVNMWLRHVVATWSRHVVTKDFKRRLQHVLPNMWSQDMVKNKLTNLMQTNYHRNNMGKKIKKKKKEKKTSGFLRIIFALPKAEADR